MNTVSTSQKLIDSLFRRINYERNSQPGPDDFKLVNMSALLERLGNPHLACPVVHVAGTKGKGSVSAFVGSVLQAAGYRTGVYSSPHLERINQRIVIDGVEISDDQLEHVVRKLQPAITELDQAAEHPNSRKLTFFEVITAAAFQHFSDQALDAVVLEVGMGGRLDSTNLCQPEICVITNISLDHTRQLGSTVEKIAAEKAGIIKRGVPVVSGVTEDGPRQVIAEIAAERNAPLIQLGRDFDFSPGADSTNGFDFNKILSGEKHGEMTGVICGMLGKHQHQNASLAISVCQQLQSNGWNLSESEIREGLAKASLPGRCEVVSERPLVVLDMAHNEASTRSLVEVLASNNLEFKTAEKKTLIFAISKEKDAAAMLAPLVQFFDEIYITQYQNNPRCRPIDEVQAIAESLVADFQSGVVVLTADSPDEAWHRATDRISPNSAVCVTGSAFLVAEMRPMILKNRK